ncbi:MAG: IQ calmodulin-binding motif-containing protein [Burkholderiaceae bacterium]
MINNTTKFQTMPNNINSFFRLNHFNCVKSSPDERPAARFLQKNKTLSFIRDFIFKIRASTPQPMSKIEKALKLFEEVSKSFPPERKNPEEQAAIKLQSAWRGHSTRQNLLKKVSPYNVSLTVKEGFVEKELAAFASLERGSEALNSIGPDHPLFYIKAVRKNSKIQQGITQFDKDPNLKKLSRELTESIKQGNWNEPLLSSTAVRDRFPEKSPKVEVKDALFYAYLTGSLNRSEFNTAIRLLNLKEQFASDRSGPYIDKNNNPQLLPMSEGTVVASAIVMDGKLTEKGKIFVETLVKKIIHTKGSSNVADGRKTVSEQIAEEDSDSEEDSLYEKYSVDEEKLVFERIEKKFLSAPANQQVIFSVKNFDFYNFWEAALNKNLNYTETDSREILVASYGLDYELSTLHAPFLEENSVLQKLTAVQPILVTGSVNSSREQKMHLGRDAPFATHPVISLDDRTKSNILSPHGVPAGAFIGELHDSGFHIQKSTAAGPVYRNLLCDLLPNRLKALVDTNDAKEAKSAAKLTDYWLDLAMDVRFYGQNWLSKIILEYKELEQDDLRIIYKLIEDLSVNNFKKPYAISSEALATLKQNFDKEVQNLAKRPR